MMGIGANTISVLLDRSGGGAQQKEGAGHHSKRGTLPLTCPKIISHDRSSKLGFIVRGSPNSSVKKACVSMCV